MGSELICKSKAQRRYRAFDFWTSHWEFEWFRERCQADCERFAHVDESGSDEDIVPA